MLGNSEQVLNILSSSNQWPQQNHQIRDGKDDQRSLNSSNSSNKQNVMAATTTTTRVMEKPSQEQIQLQQQPLKCPRCDSTNTKFCYYNNYSLSQPRHFCKACKRYWTRGGTLRNVPVGGGCRKNKRVRRPSSNSSSSTATNSSNNSSSMNESNTFSSQSLNPSGIRGGGGGGGGGAHLVNPMLYGLPTNLVHHHHPSPHEVVNNGFPFSGYDNHHHHHQQQQHQLGGLGLGFSSAGILGGGDHGFSTTPKQILQELISNSNPSSLASTSIATTTTTTLPTMSMSSLLTSGLQQQQQKFNFRSLLPYDLDLQMKGVRSHGNDGVFMKDDHVKLEDDGPHHGQHQIQSGYEIHDHHQPPPVEASDPSILWCNNNSNGNSIGVNWLDPNFSSIGSSSVPSLI